MPASSSGSAPRLSPGWRRTRPTSASPSGRGSRLATPSGEAGWPGAGLAETYQDLRDTSIDYALLEPASLEARVAVVPIAVGWSDLGSWSALRDQRAADGCAGHQRPRATARVIDVDGVDVLVHAAGGRTVATVGLEGIIVVDTPEALLVISADAAQDVKKVVNQLKAEESDLL